MKLQLKRSNVLELGAAKEPTAAQMEYGELAVNYNNGDPAIFLKDSNDNIIRIAGVGNINSGDTPSGGVLPPTGNQVGDVFFNTTNNTMYYWDGTQWVPIANDVTAADIFVGTLAEIDAEVPKADRRNGFLWWNTEDGTLYIWYIDANTSQWVIAIPSTGGGGGGASVAVNNVPPTSPDQGDMWWNTTDGRLYIWYQDADTGQWVDASPDSQVSPITSGASFPSTALENDMFFNTTDGRLYIYYNDGSSLQWVDASPDSQSELYWDRTGTTLSPTNAGDDVDLGNIQLNADGSASFAGNITAGDYPTPSVFISAQNLLASINPKAATVNSCGVAVYTDGSNNGTVILRNNTGDGNIILSGNDGSATFAGGVAVENYLYCNRQVSGDEFGLQVAINDNPRMVAKASGVYIGSNLTNINSTIGGDNIWLKNTGDATFKGNVTANNVSFNLEADDNTKYTSTTDADGNETLVYNGAVLDVKALLLTLQTAAARIETLEAEVQALKGGN